MRAQREHVLEDVLKFATQTQVALDLRGPWGSARFCDPCKLCYRLKNKPTSFLPCEIRSKARNTHPSIILRPHNCPPCQVPGQPFRSSRNRSAKVPGPLSEGCICKDSIVAAPYAIPALLSTSARSMLGRRCMVAATDTYYVCMYVCMYTHMYIYINIYISTYLYMHMCLFRLSRHGNGES